MTHVPHTGSLATIENSIWCYELEFEEGFRMGKLICPFL
jgi:hypothetical protein